MRNSTRSSSSIVQFTALLFLTLLLPVFSQAQNKTLGVGAASPNPNAALHVESPTSNQGFIMPRLTTAQRTAMGSLLTSSDNGLMLYDTDLQTIYIWDGTSWKTTGQVAGGAKLGYPYEDIVTTPTGTNDLFALRYDNAENKRVMRLENLNAANGSSTLSVFNAGTGFGGFFQVNNPSAGGTALSGSTNSNLGGAVAPVGVYGESTGSGSLGAAFRINNTANNFPTVYAETNGIGNALSLNVINPSNTAPALNINHDGEGHAIIANKPIQATQFIGDGSGLTNLPPMSLPFNTSLGNASTLFGITNTGTGFAGEFTINNASNAGPALNTTTNGTGAAIRAQTSTGFASIFASHDGSGNAIQAENTATGSAGKFIVNNTASGSPALWAETNSNQPLSAPIYGLNTGTGDPAGVFRINNDASTVSALFAETNGGGASVMGNQTGTGRAAQFQIQNATNNEAAVRGFTNGLGRAGFFTINNPSNGNAGIFSTTNGAGHGIHGENTGTGNGGFFSGADGTGLLSISNGSTSQAIEAYKVAGGGNSIQAGHNGANTHGPGNAIYAFADGGASNAIRAEINSLTGTGSAIAAQTGSASNSFAGVFSATNVSNTYPAIQASTMGTGPGVRVMQGATSMGKGMDILLQNTSGTAPAFDVAQMGLVEAGFFEISNPSNSYASLIAETNGTGTSLLANHTGASGNVAVFQSNSSNVARIDKTGMGFFNGGTQASGADIAELFDVEGNKNNYEPGDVLVISKSTDRTVEKSSSPSSTKVAGVYATKPGVRLTERDITELTDDLVPMGVVGVIPTKVCLENGPIKRGDLLVTSSKPGHAMKAIPVNVNGTLIYPTGAILGKALENFDGQETGLIKVLVNVK